MTIDVQQPRPYDIVGNTIHLGGVAGAAFEAGFSYRVTEGHDEVTGHFMAGDGIGGHGQFQVSVDVSGAAFHPRPGLHRGLPRLAQGRQ